MLDILQSDNFKLFGTLTIVHDTNVIDWNENIELELQYKPNSLKLWLNYIQLNKHRETTGIILLHLRALKGIPTSFKLWEALFQQLDAVIDQEKDEKRLSELLDAVEDLYRRAIAHLSRVPKLRLMFCDFLWQRRRKATEARRQYDYALQAIPITQHYLIWRSYLTFIYNTNLPITIKTVLKRFVQLYPEYSELYISHLIQCDEIDEAVQMMAQLVVDESFTSLLHNSKQEQWLNLCLCLSKNADKVTSLDGDVVIRTAINKFPDDISSLWCCLATYYGILGDFNLCCYTFDEALNSIRSSKDFQRIYESYSSFLEVGIASLVARKGSESEIHYRIDHLERLIDSREEILSSVRIRRNPNDVFEWMNRVQIFMRPRERLKPTEKVADEDMIDQKRATLRISKQTHTSDGVADPLKVIETFSEAIRSVDPYKSIGPISLLWIEFAHFYELFDQLEDARRTLERGCEAKHKNLDSLVTIWCERVELELRHELPMEALALVRKALLRKTHPAAIRASKAEKEEPAPEMIDKNLDFDPLQYRLHRSPRLWALCADLEESFGTFQSMRSAYDKMFDLKTITVLQIINLGSILEKRGFFEDAFQVYEKGINLFRWPHLNELWIYYLSKFVSRYGNRKLDRARELFERVLADVPRKSAAKFYFIYAKYEEHFGLIRNTLAIYHRAIQNIPDAEKLCFYKILIHTTAEYFGLTKTRPIFEEALKSVPDTNVKEVGLRYANLEMALLEVERARGIFQHVATFCDPIADADFWQQWRQFELNRGDEETFREMLRKKKSVTAQFEEINALQFNEEKVEEEIEKEMKLMVKGSGD